MAWMPRPRSAEMRESMKTPVTWLPSAIGPAPWADVTSLPIVESTASSEGCACCANAGTEASTPANVHAATCIRMGLHYLPPEELRQCRLGDVVRRGHRREQCLDAR